MSRARALAHDADTGGNACSCTMAGDPAIGLLSSDEVDELAVNLIGAGGRSGSDLFESGDSARTCEDCSCSMAGDPANGLLSADVEDELSDNRSGAGGSTGTSASGARSSARLIGRNVLPISSMFELSS